MMSGGVLDNRGLGLGAIWPAHCILNILKLWGKIMYLCRQNYQERNQRKNMVV